MGEWSTRWYVPLAALGALLLALLVGGVAMMERVAAGVSGAVDPQPWTLSLDRSDAALERGDIGTALAAWREANAFAIQSRQWEGMVAVGDAARRLGAHGAPVPDSVALARRAYLTALFRARRNHSVDGALRVAVCFGELGDHEIVERALRVAERDAAGDPVERARVRAVADRWTSPSQQADRRDSTPDRRQP